MQSVTMVAAVAMQIGSAAGAAHPTVRIEPFPVHFDEFGRTVRRNVEIWVDNIPSPGLASFVVALDSRPRDPDSNDIVKCPWFEKAVLDPDLMAAWDGRASEFFSAQDGQTELIWSGRARNLQPGMPLPTGTIRLGLLIAVRSDGCPEQGEYWFEPGQNLFGSTFFANMPFQELRGVPWIRDPELPDLDVTASCARVAPLGAFVDGDELDLQCTVTNLGTTSFGLVPPLLVAVFSEDLVFDPADDPEIVRSNRAGVLGGGEMVDFVLSSRPVRTTPGTINICTKIDVDESGFDQGWGTKWETDETNNVECQPMTIGLPHRDLVVVPGSVGLAADPREPAGLFRAGLDVGVTYDVLNRGNGAVRQDHTNRVLLGPSAPGTEICNARVDPNDGLPIIGGATLTESFGLGTGTTSNHCKIPFRHPPGAQSLFIQLDTGNTVLEDDPNTVPDPAEDNNLLSIPITVTKPLDPQFRIQHKTTEPNDQRVEIFGPGTGKVLAAVASATGLTSYSFDLSWDPPGLLALGNPDLPGGDPSQVAFRSFLQRDGLGQSCSVTSIDPVGGRAGVACTTTNPSGTGTPAWTELSEAILDVTLTPILPGEGTFTISNVAATDGAGQPFPDLRVANGTFVISGVPELSVIDPVPAPAAWPGVEFSVSFDLMNDGFGPAQPPLLTELIVSADAFNDPFDAFSPDLRACGFGETSPLPGKTTVGRTLTGCRIFENVRPGLYTGFYQVQNQPDPNRRSTAVIPFPSRVLALRKGAKGRSLEVRRHPVTVGDSAGGAMVGAKSLAGGSIASVRSTARNLDWMVHLHRASGGKGKLFVDAIPHELNAPLEALRELRVRGNVRKVLAGADIDGDGEDELVLLRHTKRGGDVLEFRRMDYTAEFPSICTAAAVTPETGEKIVAAAGIQADGDPEDEVAIVTSDGVLSLYDLDLVGPVPPAEPCLLTPLPFIVQPPATANLVGIASDTGFAAGGERARSLCALDYDLDGTEELGSLLDTGGGSQALRILAPPAAMGGSVILLADDPTFGGSESNGRILALSCTR
jgi:hypothetical protein